MQVIDARGLSCPEPVVLISKALRSQEQSYQIVVDNLAAKENVSRYAENHGYQVSVTNTAGDYQLELSKS